MQSEKTIFGRQAVIEAVEASKTITKVFIHRDLNKSSAERLVRTLENSKIPYSYVPIQKLNKLTPHNHQGVVAQLSEITFSSLEELIETHEKPGLFVLLDGITDTRNMGAIIRSAAAANATASKSTRCLSNEKPLRLENSRFAILIVAVEGLSLSRRCIYICNFIALSGILTV